jgi:hypothetical protein
MDETPTDKLEAILEELETERERRQRAKVESGEIARVELTVAVGEPQELESAVAKAKADKLAELQAAGLPKMAIRARSRRAGSRSKMGLWCCLITGASASRRCRCNRGKTPRR